MGESMSCIYVACFSRLTIITKTKYYGTINQEFFFLLWIVIVISFSISHLIFSRDVSLIVCVFSFFTFITTKMHNYPMFVCVCLG